MKTLVLLLTLIITSNVQAQCLASWINGVCDFTDGQQWNNGGAKGCACSWYDLQGNLNCAYGDCGQDDICECLFDCNGHNGMPTDQQPRTCDASASPICWFQGAGNAGELFCQNLFLPIELVDFWGTANESYIEINWSTATETNNDYFELFYSTDGESYTSLTRMEGQGTSTTLHNYRFIHTNPIKGINYYIVKQVDYNGEYTNSPAIAVRSEYKSNTLFSDIYINSGLIYFNYNGTDYNTPIKLKLISLCGNIVSELTIENFNNSQGIPLKLINFEKGIYLININQDNNLETKKVYIYL